MSEVVSLAEASDTAVFGSKAVGLGQALRDGLPVPPGVALSGAIVEAVAGGHEDAIERVASRGQASRRAARRALVRGRRGRCRRELRRPAPDAAQRSLGGRGRQRTAGDLVVGELRLRDHLPQARRPLHEAERRPPSSRSLLDPETAGVMFTQNPVTGADERMIEASWGLGEAVVAGMVIPDSFSVDRAGNVLGRRAGLKRIAIRGVAGGGTIEDEVPAELVRAALPRRRSARAAQRARVAMRGGLRPGAGHRVGDRRRHALPAPVPSRHEGRVRPLMAGRSGCRAPARAALCRAERE